MKKILSLFMTIILMTSLTACGSSKNAVTSAQDVQGFWYDEDAYLVLGFKGNEYIYYGFDTGFSITGTFEVEDETLTLHSDEVSDKVYESAKIEDGILSYKVPGGSVVQWESITEDEVIALLEQFEE